jgi:hypothetical protein
MIILQDRVEDAKGLHSQATAGSGIDNAHLCRCSGHQCQFEAWDGHQLRFQESPIAWLVQCQLFPNKIARLFGLRMFDIHLPYPTIHYLEDEAGATTNLYRTGTVLVWDRKRN